MSDDSFKGPEATLGLFVWALAWTLIFAAATLAQYALIAFFLGC